MGNNNSNYNIIRVTPTLDTSAYAQGDVLFTATAIPNAVKGDGGCSMLVAMYVLNQETTEIDIEFIFSEFREGISNGFKNLGSYGNKYRLDPTYSSVKQFFPEAKLTMYTDNRDLGKNYNDVEIRLVDIESSPFDKSNHRWGWHACDYYQVKGWCNY